MWGAFVSVKNPPFLNIWGFGDNKHFGRQIFIPALLKNTPDATPFSWNILSDSFNDWSVGHLDGWRSTLGPITYQKDDTPPEVFKVEGLIDRP